MAFHLRKLLFDDSDCKQYCSPLNTEGKCPPSCNSPICLYYCTKPLNDDVSPLPSTPNDNNDSPDEPHLVPNSSHHTISLFLTIPLVIISTILFFLICFTIYKLCIKRYALRRRRELNRAGENLPGPDPDLLLDEDHGPNQGPAVEHHVWYIRTVGLDPSVISQITIVKYNKTDGLIEGTDCSVCLSGFEENETLRLLPKCNHAFHLPCIDTWLTSHTTCPLCRAGIVKNTVNLPSHEVIVQDSSSVEENLGEISRTSSSGEELRVEDVGNNTRLVGRSVSMDALSGAIIRNDCERSSGDQIVDVKELDGKRDGGINQLLRLVGSLSIDRPACIKRSASCSANVL